MLGSKGYIHKTEQGTWSLEDGWINTNYITRDTHILGYLKQMNLA